MQFVTALLVSAALPGIAIAQCPVAADLERGIIFDVGDNEREIFTRMDADRIEATYMFDDVGGSRVILAQGVYLLEIVDVENDIPVAGTRTTYAFPMPVEELPQITPGGGWNTKVALRDSGGLDSEEQVYRFGEEVTLTIGACTYQMIPIEITYPSDQANLDMDRLHYLPELGLSFLAGSNYDGTDNSYNYHTIRLAN